MKKTKTKTTLKEVLKPFRDEVEGNFIYKDVDLKHFNPTGIIRTQFNKSVMQYLPIILKKYADTDMKYPKEWFTNLINRFGLEDVVKPESLNNYIQEYEKSTKVNSKQYANDIINIVNELKSVTNDDDKGPRYFKAIKNEYDEGVEASSIAKRKTKDTESEHNKNGEAHANRRAYLEKLKNNFENNIDKIVKPTVIASVIGSITDNRVEEYVHSIMDRSNAYSSDDYTRLDEFKIVKDELNDIIDDIAEKYPETDVKVETVEVEKPKLAPKLEIESLPETVIEEPEPTPLQSLGINNELTKSYKPNLQDHSETLFDQSVMSDTEEESYSPFSITSDTVQSDQSDEETVISDSMNTPEVPSSREFVSPKAYCEGLKDYLENVNARYLDFKQAFIDSGIITEDNLKELAGVPSIIEKLRRDFSDSTKQLTKDVVQDWNDKLKYIKDLIAKHGATMQKQYRLEAKLNTVDVKTEDLMRELKANSTLAYLLKLPTSTYEKLPDSIKKACELYREKQNELNNYIASRKKLIPKRAMNKKISKPVSSYVLNPMLKRGYQVFQ